MKLQEIQEYIKNKLSEKRYYHSVCVMERSKELALKFGADIEIAQKIGIAHDVAKEMSEEEKLKYVKENNIEIDETEKFIEAVLLCYFFLDDNCNKYYVFHNDKFLSK